MVHTVQQIVDEEVHVAVKGNRVKKNKLVFVVRIMGEATMRTHSGKKLKSFNVHSMCIGEAANSRPL